MSLDDHPAPAGATPGFEDGPMSKHQRIAEGLGLHGRTIVAMLDLLERGQTTLPQLDAVAEALEVPLEDVQRIFPDIHAVMVAAAEQALVLLIDNCVKAVVKVDPEDAVAQFTALGDAYIDWASVYHAQFRLLSDDRLLDTLGTPQLRRYLDSLTELMTRMLERAQQSGRLSPDENIHLMVLSSRTFAYGLARMVIDHRMAEWYPDAAPIEAAKVVLHDFVRRFARGSLRRQR
ncbi:WHG domain-containing protein [Paracoccus marinaquae]|uniref:WHG domain-containing protein n=1 Tax=Paracoccus marinaquae TaxID=2841926 RepID=A0ABS6AGS7_9RHOB|nr:WHG domain-containing protein [Paracoccus marinaquae]MBU3029792.1 WHG domain-containing protein [Paracoccus marinaquae]